MRVFLVGMMGSGKSTVGKLLARSLGMGFFDTDEEIERREGKSITQIFKDEGEEYFRKLEKSLLKEILNSDNVVVATGGGVVLDLENRTLLQREKTVFLYASVEALVKRVDPTVRPLIAAGEVEKKLRDIWEKRRHFYMEFPQVNTENLNPMEVVAKVALKVFDEDPIEIPNSVHPVFIGKGIFNRVSREEHVFTTKNVFRIYGDCFPGSAYILPDGEVVKSFDYVRRCYDHLIENDVSKGNTITAVGGGALTDMVGFVAATFKRGIGVRFFPTTLLAQVDAAIGGKNGIDHAGIKNVIGTVRMPDEVMIDPLVLLSLDDERYREGLVELFKMCLLSGKGYETFRDKMKEILKRRVDVLQELITVAVEEKLKVVSLDHNDTGIRKILNLGHTVGHVVEVLSGVSHGFAVAVGIDRELRFFVRKGMIEKSLYEEVKETLSRLFESLEMDFSQDRVMKTLLNDKKATADSLIDMPLLLRPGEVSMVKVRPEELAEVIV